MKKIVIDVKEKVENMYSFEVTLKDFDKDLLDELANEIEEKAKEGYEGTDFKYAIKEYLEEELELSEDDYRIHTFTYEARNVENELERIYLLGE